MRYTLKIGRSTAIAAQVLKQEICQYRQYNNAQAADTAAATATSSTASATPAAEQFT